MDKNLLEFYLLSFVVKFFQVLILMVFNFTLFYSGCFSDDENCDSECHFSGPEHDRCKCTRSTSISSK